MSDFQQRCTRIAESFLQTAVIVDDGAYNDGSLRTPTSLKTPDQRTSSQVPEETALVAPGETDARHSLDARILVDAFAKRGLICGVIVPALDVSSAPTVTPAARRADIVILDWQIHGDHGERALSMLSEILQTDGGDRLRLIAVYTGEGTISDIGQKIASHLKAQGYVFEPQSGGIVLSCGYCRIVIYAKSSTSLPRELTDRAISEEDIPGRLIEDFAEMAKGLLPSVALVSLAAIRENAHKVLEKFDAKLDAAFLTHRACLPIPADSQQHIVSQLASELHAIMDDAVATADPAGMGPIKEWLAASNGSNADFTFGSNRKLSFQQAEELLEHGLEQKPADLNKKKDFGILTAGFARTEDTTNRLDRQLAWMFNFRTVLNARIPILRLGTVLRRCGKTSDSDLFLCMRPRCDSVRLTGKGAVAFLLLPLDFPPTPDKSQLVIRTSTEEYQRVSVSTAPSHWVLEKFSPNSAAQAVTAQKSEDGSLLFTASDGETQYKWLGELKAEFAQRIANNFASELSRVAVDNSEWLRRMEKRRD